MAALQRMRKFAVADAFGMLIMRATKHDPEEWMPVFRRDHARSTNEVLADP